MRKIIDSWRRILFMMVLVVIVLIVITLPFILRGMSESAVSNNEDKRKSIKNATSFKEVIDVTPNAVNEYSDEDDKVIGDFAATTAETFLKVDENVCYSPISLYMSLALMAEASSGETQKEVLQVLGSKNIEQLEEYITTYIECLEMINSISAGRKAVLSNSLWIRRDNEITSSAEDIIKRCQDKLNADIMYEDFSEADINKWVEENTDGLVKELLDKRNPIHNEVECAMINTLYFQCRWTDFKVSGGGDFLLNSGKKVFVEYIDMYEKSCAYIRGNNYTIVKKAVGGIEAAGGVSVLFVCADEDVSIENLISKQTISQILASANSKDTFAKAEVTLRIPKFNYTSYIDDEIIEQKLKEMGIETLWDEPNLSGLITENGPTRIFATQKTKIGVDENGIMAATASDTEVGVALSPSPEQVIKLILDKPFMYIIERDGVPLFIGTVYNPTEG